MNASMGNCRRGYTLRTYSSTVGAAAMFEELERARNLHRPSDPALLRAEMARLRRLGLTPMDIADALSLSASAVIASLEHTGDQPCK